jgi:hypothetical protein
LFPLKIYFRNFVEYRKAVREGCTVTLMGRQKPVSPAERCAPCQAFSCPGMNFFLTFGIVFFVMAFFACFVHKEII